MKDKNIITNHINNNIVDLNNLFATPLIGCVDADIMATTKFIDFLKDFGFEKGQSNQPDRPGKLKVISFYYYTMAQGVRQRVTIEVPVLTLIPFSAFQIDSAEFEFAIDVVNVTPKAPAVQPKLITKREETDLEKTGKVYPGEQCRVRARLAAGQSAPKHTKSEKAHIGVKLKVKQSDLPSGILSMLNLLQSNIKVQEEPAQLPRSFKKFYFEKKLLANITDKDDYYFVRSKFYKKNEEYLLKTNLSKKDEERLLDILYNH